MDRSSTDATITEIVLADGEYVGHFGLRAPEGVEAAKIPHLLIHAAEGATPLFHNSIQLDEAEAVPDMPGLYRSTRIPPSDPEMWERDTRVRYTTLSNKGSVAVIAGSCFVDREENALYFRTSDGKPPQEHKVFLSLSPMNSHAFGIYRPNTTVEGLSFRDYIGVNIVAFQTYSDNVTIRRCHFDNCYRAWSPTIGTKNAVMEDCTGADVASPIFSHADHATVRGCRFEKTRDRFLYELYPQNDCGYQVYSPGHGGTFVGNFCKGYALGIFIKAGQAEYIIRHNTLVDNEQGIVWATRNNDSDTSYNIVVGASSEFVYVVEFPPTFITDYNLFWRPKNPAILAARMTTVRAANLGKSDLLADPRFVDPANGDYRLLPDSPALRLKDAEGRPAGAFGMAPIEAAAQTRPTLELVFGSELQRMGATGVYTYGGTHVRDLAEERVVPKWLTRRTEVAITLQAFDVLGEIVKTRVAVANEPAREVAYAPTYQLTLPNGDGEYPVRLEVQNDRGVWSKPAEAVICLSRRAPQLIGQPIIIANDHGLIVTFRTSRPCFAELQYGPTATYGETVPTPTLINRDYDGETGMDHVETWTIPRTEFALAVLKPKITTGQQVHLRVTLTNQAGLKLESPDYTATVKGPAKTLYVSVQGWDAPGRGNTNNPFRTLQYAVDRALPGDRV